MALRNLYFLLALGVVFAEDIEIKDEIAGCSARPSIYPGKISELQTPQQSSYKCEDFLAELNEENHPGFYFTGDFIYWYSHEDGLEFAVSGLALLPNTTSSVPPGKTYLPKFQWEPGFKLGMGYVVEKNVWDIFANWTWYHSDVHGKAQGPNAFTDSTLYPQDVYARFFNNVVQSAFAKWDLHYNTLDLSIGRLFSVGESFSVKPFSGLRGAWIDQQFNVLANGVDVSGTSVSNLTNRLDCSSVGLRTGLSSSWYFNDHFSFFGDASYSLLYGFFHDHAKLVRTLSGDTRTLIDIKDRTHSIKTEFEFGLGFRYETPLRNDCYLFSFDVAWEYLNWINMNQFYIPIVGTDPNPAIAEEQASGQFNHLNGDLGFMGFTTSFKLAF